jgi:hypothetical protein
LFEISLHPGDVAVAISEYSDHGNESKSLIAISSRFMIDEIEWIAIGGSRIADVRPRYFISWKDFNIDDPPVQVCV